MRRLLVWSIRFAAIAAAPLGRRSWYSLLRPRSICEGSSLACSLLRCSVESLLSAYHFLQDLEKAADSSPSAGAASGNRAVISATFTPQERALLLAAGSLPDMDEEQLQAELARVEKETQVRSLFLFRWSVGTVTRAQILEAAQQRLRDLVEASGKIANQTVLLEQMVTS
jgi:hypothetical protein